MRLLQACLSFLLRNFLPVVLSDHLIVHIAISQFLLFKLILNMPSIFIRSLFGKQTNHTFF